MKSQPLHLPDSEPILNQILPVLLDSYWEADTWITGLIAHDPKANFMLDSSTKASMLSNAFAHFVRPKMLTKNVSWQGDGKFQSGVIKQLIRVRFKKLTPDLHSMNSHTKAQQKIYWQQQSLPKSRLLTNVTFGYTLGGVTGRTTGLYFVCPIAWDKNLWTWPLFEADEGQYSMYGGPFDPDHGMDADDQPFEIKIKTQKKA